MWYSRWWHGLGLRNLSLIYYVSKFNLFSLIYLVHSHYVILYHFILEFFYQTLSNLQNFFPHIDLEDYVFLRLTKNFKSDIDERGHRLRFFHTHRRGGGFCIRGCGGGFRMAGGGEYGFCIVACVCSVVWGLWGCGTPGGGMGWACIVCL